MKSGRPTPVISWYKDDKNFTQKQNTSYRLISFSPDNSKITFEYITVDDSGSYKCVANNRVGKVVGEVVASRSSKGVFKGVCKVVI